MTQKYNWILDYEIHNYIGCGIYNEDVKRSLYAVDYIIKSGEIKVIQTEFTEDEFIGKLEMLKNKAQSAYDLKHKHHLNNFLGYRKVPIKDTEPLFDEGLKE